MRELDWSFDPDDLEEVASRLSLRAPNQAAVSSILQRLEESSPSKAHPVDTVAALATAVGKTYVLAGLVDHLARYNGVRNFLVVVPSTAILQKTLNQLTPGHPKYLLAGGADGQDLGGERLSVITSENFTSSRPVLNDGSTVKVFLFTVQALTSSTNRTAKRLHKGWEMLPESLYAHLQRTSDLVVIADESHNYEGGQKFSDAIRDLGAPVLIGLTATPGKGAENDGRLVFRYGLAHALLDHFVKAPVIVGRPDGVGDEKSKLHDGLTLLEKKEQAVSLAVSSRRVARRVNPVMLVVAATQEHAREVQEMLADPAMFGGRYGTDEACLVITSDSIDEATAERLEKVEEPDSPVRVIVHVSMLKEGWDVKNVFVLVVLRASESEILTEQTIGRGLRLPWGQWVSATDSPDDALDTLEIVAHDQYEQLLQARSVLNSSLLDYQREVAVHVAAETHASSGMGARDFWSAHYESEGRGNAGAQSQGLVGGGLGTPAARRLVNESEGNESATGLPVGNASISPLADIDGMPVAVTSISARREAMERNIADFELLAPEQATLSIPLGLPLVRGNMLAPKPGLHQVTDMEAIKAVARQFNVPGDVSLQRTILVGRKVDQMTAKTEQVVGDTVSVERLPLDFGQVDNFLLGTVQNCKAAVPSQGARAHAERIVRVFIDALDSNGQVNLPYMLTVAAKRLEEEVSRQLTQAAGPGIFEPLPPEWKTMPIRMPETGALAKESKFYPRHAYKGWQKSAYSTCTFDSSTERDVALLVDRDAAVSEWIRLNINDMPIEWQGGRRYNPDFLVVEQDASNAVTVWIVEVKANNAVSDTEVTGKMKAARQWCSHVSAHSDYSWEYLLVSEDDIEQCAGNWGQLKAFGLKRASEQ